MQTSNPRITTSSSTISMSIANYFHQKVFTEQGQFSREQFTLTLTIHACSHPNSQNNPEPNHHLHHLFLLSLHTPHHHPVLNTTPEHTKPPNHPSRLSPKIPKNRLVPPVGVSWQRASEDPRGADRRTDARTEQLTIASLARHWRDSDGPPEPVQACAPVCLLIPSSWKPGVEGDFYCYYRCHRGRM